ncbi:hypothetical protein EFP01_087 [Enterococcus phage EFP01]|uniref:Uncharacterized protein n=1 Tax=Enterococcus phage EFP01 TaxID=1926594 RepID=A0A288TY75_9CAUD|nr:hypothetical protein HOR47_gp087 [Enterococcus phage EFP01]APZ82014.1 hypothetical protein EFP01_087 [Enterococcus phage EFP01]
MSKTINDIIEDFDSKVNVQEVSKSIEDENVEPVQEEQIETPEAVEEGVENAKPEEQPVEAEEVKEDVEPESEPTESDEKPETESEVAEEATEPEVEKVEKSDKESDKEDEEKKSSDDEDDKEDKKDKKDKKADKEDKDEKDEDKEDVKKSDESEDVEKVEKSAISSQDILGGFEAVFKNMAGLVDVQKSLTDTIAELKSEIVSLREAREAIYIEPEEVNKSILLDKTSEVTVEGKAVGFVSKSVDVEADVTSEQEDVVEVVVEGAEQEEAPAKSDEEQLFDSVRGIRDDLMSTYTRVASSGQAPRGELEEIRQLWGRIKSQDELARAQAFIDKYK